MPLAGDADGAPRGQRSGLYEFVLIEEHEGGLRYRVKHFNPDMVGRKRRTASTNFRGCSLS